MAMPTVARSAAGLATVALWLSLPVELFPQGLTGTLVGTVRDPQGGVVPGAQVRLTSPDLIGGVQQIFTDERGHLRFPVLPPGRYSVRVERAGFAPHLVEGLVIRAGETIEHQVRLDIAPVVLDTTVDGSAGRIDVRDAGWSTRFGPDELAVMPSRRASMYDVIRAAPGISPTSPSSGTSTTVSAFGSGTNENHFLIDGTNFTCPCNGVARSEPGIDFIQEVHIQSIGASAEFGSVQGAVINVIMKDGGSRWQVDSGYFGQAASLTSAPVQSEIRGSGGRQSGYHRHRYVNVSAGAGGPAIPDRLWIFGGYEYLRDFDSQPGVAPEEPRRFSHDKVFGKLTWRLSPAWRLVNSAHFEHWENPETPTVALPYTSTLNRETNVPAATFAQLTGTSGSATTWDMRVGGFSFLQESRPITGDLLTPNRIDTTRSITVAGTRDFGNLSIRRTTAKATVSRFVSRWIGVGHDWRAGVQLERGAHDATSVLPGGVRFIDSNGRPVQSIAADPSNTGAVAITASAFASDAVNVGSRLSISAGLRFDHARAIVPDLPAVDGFGEKTDMQVAGLGTVYRWNVLSPRLGTVVKLTADGRTVARASFGRFHAGVLTGELSPFHPGEAVVTTRNYVEADGAYSLIQSQVHPTTNLLLDSGIRSPYTDELSVGIDRQLGQQVSVAAAYIHKSGRDFIGWTDVGGQYVVQQRTLADGSEVDVFVLTSDSNDRRFLLTNPPGYSMTYDGLVLAIEKRRRNGWHASGSYTLSRAFGLQASGGATAAAPQVTTIAPPPSTGLTFGQNPNDLINARGRLPNDRPHVLRAMTSAGIPRTGLVVAASVQHFSGKPWAAAASVRLEGTPRRILLEPRGSRRLSSQSLVDVRVSRPFRVGTGTTIEVTLDVLNLLNDSAEEGLVSDVLLTERETGSTFGVPNVFMDPRRAMFSARLGWGR